MQTIAGIHYNWSIPDEALSLLQTGKRLDSSFQDYKTQSYFDPKLLFKDKENSFDWNVEKSVLYCGVYIRRNIFIDATQGIIFFFNCPNKV